MHCYAMAQLKFNSNVSLWRINIMSNADPIILEPMDLYNQLRVIDLAEFLSLNLPPRELILTPWLPRAGLCMLHAFRGVGKTHLSLGIAYAVAKGSSFLTWQSEK